MHFAQTECKRLLHSPTHYAFRMTTPNERLRKARARHFESAADAARALNVPVGTYAGHENGHRGFPAKRAPQYAKKFKTTPEWLLYGTGPEDVPDPVPSEEVLEQMLREAIQTEVTVDTKLADLPRILGSNLHEQLKRFEADPKVANLWDEKLDRVEAARSRAPTRQSGEAGSRSA